LHNRKAHSGCAAFFADRFMSMESSPSGRGECRRAYATHGGRPARHTQVTSGQFTFFEVFARAKRTAPAAVTNEKCEHSSGISNSEPVGRGHALRSRECDELYRGPRDGRFNGALYSRRSSVEISYLKAGFPITHRLCCAEMVHLKSVSAPTETGNH